jgi:hypothetical protein
MPAKPTGLLVCDGDEFVLHSAKCYLLDGSLYIRASGAECEFFLVGVPLDAQSYAQLPGAMWEPDEDQLAYDADVLAEGGLSLHDERIEVDRVKVECIRLDSARAFVDLEVEFSGELPSAFVRKDFAGIVRCQIVEPSIDF